MKFTLSRSLVARSTNPKFKPVAMVMVKTIDVAIPPQTGYLVTDSAWRSPERVAGVTIDLRTGDCSGMLPDLVVNWVSDLKGCVAHYQQHGWQRQDAGTMTLSARVVADRQSFLTACDRVRAAEKKWIATQNEIGDIAWEICYKVLMVLRSNGFFGSEAAPDEVYIDNICIGDTVSGSVNREGYEVVMEFELELLDLGVDEAANIVAQRMINTKAVKAT